MSKHQTAAVPFFEDAAISDFDKRVKAIDILKEVHLKNMDDVEPLNSRAEAAEYRWYHIQTEEQRQALLYLCQIGIGESELKDRLPLPSVAYVETTDASWLAYADQEDLDSSTVYYSTVNTVANSIEHIEKVTNLLHDNGLYEEVSSISGRITALKIAFKLLPVLEDELICEITGLSLAEIDAMNAAVQLAMASLSDCSNKDE